MIDILIAIILIAAMYVVFKENVHNLIKRLWE